MPKPSHLLMYGLLATSKLIEARPDNTNSSLAHCNLNENNNNILQITYPPTNNLIESKKRPENHIILGSVTGEEYYPAKFDEQLKKSKVKQATKTPWFVKAFANFTPKTAHRLLAQIKKDKKNEPYLALIYDANVLLGEFEKETHELDKLKAMHYSYIAQRSKDAPQITLDSLKLALIKGSATWPTWEYYHLVPNLLKITEKLKVTARDPEQFISSTKNREFDFHLYYSHYRYGLADAIKPNFRKMVDLLEDGIQNNLPKAYYLLGDCHEHGIGKKVNRAKALNHYKKAAALGDKQAQQRLTDLQKTSIKPKNMIEYDLNAGTTSKNITPKGLFLFFTGFLIELAAVAHTIVTRTCRRTKPTTQEPALPEQKETTENKNKKKMKKLKTTTTETSDSNEEKHIDCDTLRSKIKELKQHHDSSSSHYQSFKERYNNLQSKTKSISHEWMEENLRAVNKFIDDTLSSLNKKINISINEHNEFSEKIAAHFSSINSIDTKIIEYHEKLDKSEQHAKKTKPGTSISSTSKIANKIERNKTERTYGPELDEIKKEVLQLKNKKENNSTPSNHSSQNTKKKQPTNNISSTQTTNTTEPKNQSKSSHPSTTISRITYFHHWSDLAVNSLVDLTKISNTSTTSTALNYAKLFHLSRLVHAIRMMTDYTSIVSTHSLLSGNEQAKNTRDKIIHNTWALDPASASKLTDEVISSSPMQLWTLRLGNENTSPLSDESQKKLQNTFHLKSGGNNTVNDIIINAIDKHENKKQSVETKKIDCTPSNFLKRLEDLISAVDKTNNTNALGNYITDIQSIHSTMSYTDSSSTQEIETNYPTQLAALCMLFMNCSEVGKNINNSSLNSFINHCKNLRDQAAHDYKNINTADILICLKLASTLTLENLTQTTVTNLSR